MTWFFRITGLIFLLFAGVVGAGAFLPGVQTLEASAVSRADPESVFDIVDDLSTHPRWSHAVPDIDGMAFGETVGTDASAAWDAGGAVGSATIVQSIPPELVLVSVESGGDDVVLTYGFGEESGGTLLFVKQEREWGGFPYLDRVAGALRRSGDVRALTESIDTLAALSEPLISPEETTP